MTPVHATQSLDKFTDSKEIYYFAYGSNLDEQQMEKRRKEGSKKLWPDATEATPATFKGIAVLKDFSLNFNKISSTIPGTHYASIIPKKDSIVEGVIYQLDKKFIQILDAYEGNGYTREAVKVDIKIENSASQSISALVYIAHPNASIKTGEQGAPTKKYLETIIRGAKAFGLSQETIKKLETWPTAKI